MICVNGIYELALVKNIKVPRLTDGIFRCPPNLIMKFASNHPSDDV